MGKGAVISGGGSWGAYTVGMLKALDDQYDLVVGCSTGALMAPLVGLKAYDRLMEAYSSIKISDIFNKNPFNKHGKLSKWKIMWMLFRGYKTLGRTDALRDTIKKLFTLDDYEELRNRNINVVVTITCLSSKNIRTEYKSVLSESYEDFVDYMWASASLPIIGTLIKKNNEVYCDGGLTDNVPLRWAVENNSVTSVDCFIHEPMLLQDYVSQPKNIFELAGRVVDIMKVQDMVSSFEKGKESCDAVTLRVFNLPEQPVESFVTFDSTIMKQWIGKGFDYIKNK